VSVPFFAMTLAVLALTIATASVSWFLLERPVLRLKRLSDRGLARRPGRGSRDTDVAA
jgi:peptidoglycan/LPS O-acetylase OafA/YrhL